MPGLPGGFFTFGHAHTTLSLRATEVALQFLTVSLEFVVCFIPFLSRLWLFYGRSISELGTKDAESMLPLVLDLFNVEVRAFLSTGIRTGRFVR